MFVSCSGVTAHRQALQTLLLTDFCYLCTWKRTSHIESEYQKAIYYISPLCVLNAPTWPRPGSPSTLHCFSHTPLNRTHVMITFHLWDTAAIFSASAHLVFVTFEQFVIKVLMCDSHITSAINASLCVPKVLAIRSNEIQLQRFLALSAKTSLLYKLSVLWCSYLCRYRTLKPYLHWAEIRQRTKRRRLISVITFLFLLSCLLYERLLRFLFPFPHANVKMLKVNDKLIVS